jgi:Transposase DDE domain
MPAAPIAQTSFSGDFSTSFAELLDDHTCHEIFQNHGPRGGGLPKLSGWQWLMGKVYHVMAGSGNFADHVKQITGISISNSALSQRGASVGWELVATALRSVLRPLADPQEHPDAFHQGLRLIALDGTRFDLSNTAAMKERAVKKRCYRGDGEPAFAQLCSVVVVELGTHQPLAAAFGWKNQGELTLARQACAEGTLPPGSLLLGDRLFGTPSLMHELLPELESSGGGLLFRVKGNMKSRVIEVLGDGSRLVEVEVRDTETRKLIGILRLREIHAEVCVEQGKGKPLKIRLWTNLLDITAHPARQLVELYAMRWEQELFYRELKSHLHGGGSLLKSQTPESAAQEALAMMMAASLIARQRAVVAATAGVEMKRVSFAKVLDATVALCRVLEIGRDLINDHAREEWVRRVLEELAVTALIPKRKPRSCTRGLRQTTQNWPKIKNPTSKPLVKTITLTNP